jgi:peptide/nickel transport system substrate-binding protein
MVSRKLKRREFLKLSSVAVIGAVAASCAPAPTPVPPTVVLPTQTPVVVEKVVEKQVQVTVEVPTKRAEPPMLADLVKAGKLPPVDERLPQTPMVVGGRDGIGVYGGEVRMVHFDPTWCVSNYDWNAERMLHYSDIDLRTIVPNILEGWEVSPDGKEFTLKLLKGMKWSTGDPVTSEDIRFDIEDVWYNTDIHGSPMWQLRVGGPNAKLDVIDDFTVKLTYAAPFGNLPAHMTRWEPNNWPGIIAPSKYLKNYHPKYTDPAKLDAMAKAEKKDTWVQLFQSRNDWGMGTWEFPSWMFVEGADPFPVLAPWVIKSQPDTGIFLLERNPYYWKIDLAGNQLPYIDSLRYDYVTNVEAVKLKLVQSQLDAVGMHDVTMSEYPYYKENESKANYKVADYISCMSDRAVFFPQHYITDDAVLTEIVNNPKFSQALSVAIDRDELNQTLFYGTARMGQMGPMPVSKYYKEKYGTAWAQFDKDLANQLLDEMGLDKKDANGIRLRSDGKPLTWLIENAGTRVGPIANKICEMLANYWREVGIDATNKESTESLINDRLNTGQVHCTMWHADRCTDMLLPMEMRWYIPTDSGQGGVSSVWAKYYQAADKTAAGLVKPPDNILNYYNLFDQMQSVVSEDERVKIGQQIFDGLAEAPLAIGLLLECPAPLIYNKNMRNLPRPKVLMGWDSYGNSIYHPEAFYYEGGQRA